MNYRALIAAAATGAALLGCVATPSAQTSAQTSPQTYAQARSEPGFEQRSRDFTREYASVLCASNCAVTITVLENCTIRVTPYTLGVPRGSSNVPIRWTISSSSVGNAKFAATRGVFFKGGDWSREFDNERRLSDTQFMWNDRNPQLPTRARPFPYGINVVQNDRPCPTYDPTVVNDF
jgi:hypothetical protein